MSHKPGGEPELDLAISECAASVYDALGWALQGSRRSTHDLTRAVAALVEEYRDAKDRLRSSVATWSVEDALSETRHRGGSDRETAIRARLGLTPWKEGTR